MDKLKELITNYELYKDGLYKEPHSIAYTSDHDDGTIHSIGAVGRDRRMKHLKMDLDYKDSIIKYEYNELGLRGPQPKEDAKYRIIFAGSCTFKGEGVLLQESFPHILSSKMDANYINVSDAGNFAKMLEEVEGHAKWYKPHLIVLGESRFFDVFEWIDAYLRVQMKKSYLYDKEIPEEFRHEVRGQLKERNFDLLKYIFHYLSNKYPNVWFLHSNDSYAKKLNDGMYEGVNTLYINDRHHIDLGRDCRHPGPGSHELIANELYNEIHKR